MNLSDIYAKYPDAVTLVSMAQAVWEGSTASVKVAFPVSGHLAAKLRELLGKDIRQVFITDNDVRHTRKHHSVGEEKRGQGNITPEDFAYLPIVLNEFDHAEHMKTTRSGLKKLEFVKELDGKIYAAAMEQGNSQIGVITLWKSARQGAPMLAPEAPASATPRSLTPEAPPAGNL
jgi:hypothetical protein